MDLSNLKPNTENVLVKLVHPVTEEPVTNEDGSQMTITVLHPQSKEYKAIQYEQQNEKIKKMQKLGKNAMITAQELEETSITILAKMTVEWNITYDSKKPRLSVEKAKEIYSDFYWIVAQIEEAIADQEVFTKT